MSRKILIAANWKMNLTPSEAVHYAQKIRSKLTKYKKVEIMVTPNTLALPFVAEALRDSNIVVGAQNIYYQDEGAYTGEISAPMLKGLASYVLVGHSERRHVFRESERETRFKVQAALRVGLKPILCIGDTARQHANGEVLDVLRDQLISGLANVSSEEMKDVVIAYEPVWAISNGKDFASHKTASAKDAEKAATEIRRQIKALFGEATSKEVRILYGASVNTDNAAGFLKAKGVDGLLVGGASLNAEIFTKIVESANQLAKSTKKASKK